MASGHIYAMQAVGTPYIKIGSTTGSPEKRLKTLQTGQPFPRFIPTGVGNTPNPLPTTRRPTSSLRAVKGAPCSWQGAGRPIVTSYSSLPLSRSAGAVCGW